MTPETQAAVLDIVSKLVSAAMFPCKYVGIANTTEVVHASSLA